MLSQVKHLVPNSRMEMGALMRTLGITDIPFTVAPCQSALELGQ